MKKLTCILSFLTMSMAQNVFAFGSHEDNVQLKDTQQIQSQILRFPIKNLNGDVISDNEIIASIIYSILNNSQYQYITSRKNYSRDETTQNINTHQKYQQHVDGLKRDFSGVLARYMAESQTIKIIYTNETKDTNGSLISINGDASSTQYKDIIFDVALKIDRDQTSILVTESIPALYSIERSQLFDWGSKDPLDSPEKLYADLTSISTTNKINIPQTYVLEGEIDNKYDPSSIYGNFDRLMTKYNWTLSQTCDPINLITASLKQPEAISSSQFAICDNLAQASNRDQNEEQAAMLKQATSTSSFLGKMMNLGDTTAIPTSQNKQVTDQKSVIKYASTFNITEKQMETTYNYKLKEQNIPIVVTIYPYRGQSKISYKALIPYSINGDGTNSLSNEEIKQLKQYIETIANS